jgi:hypothetical protein
MKKDMRKFSGWEDAGSGLGWQLRCVMNTVCRAAYAAHGALPFPWVTLRFTHGYRSCWRYAPKRFHDLS